MPQLQVKNPEGTENFEVQLKIVINVAIEMMAYRCLNYKNPTLAIDLLKCFSCSKLSVVQVLSYATSDNEKLRTELALYAGLPDQTTCAKFGQDESLNIIERLQYLLLSHDSSEALKLGLAYCRGFSYITFFIIESHKCIQEFYENSTKTLKLKNNEPTTLKRHNFCSFGIHLIGLTIIV